MKMKLVLLLLLPALAVGWKLNVPRVLLPLADEGAHFTVYSEGGCFTWSSTRPEVIRVTPTKAMDECGGGDAERKAPFMPATSFDSSEASVITGCTSGAIINIPDRWGGAPSLAKAQAIVTAEDAHSPGHVLRVDVIVDRIFSLQIVTKTHELFLEEAPEEFSVRAYDDQGNEFSTLEGIVFTWTVEPSSNKRENVKFMKFRDSTYSLEPSLMALEAKGLQGSKVLLEGIRTGSSKVSVRLSAKNYADVPPAEVTVMVVANLFLVPHISFAMVGSTIVYHAEQMKSNRIHKIDLASSQQYYLEVEDLAWPRIGHKDTVIAGNQVGQAEVILRDNNVGKEDAVKSPSADLFIVQPAYIMIQIDPHNNWNVIVGGSYSLYVTVYDSQNHRLFSSSNLVAELEIDDGYFQVEATSANGTWVHGVPLKVGTAEVRAVLLGTKDVETGSLVTLETPLKAKAQLEIFDPIDLQPALSIFPWDPARKSSQQVKYKILGQSASVSSFVWASKNTSVATVTQNGLAKTMGILGETEVTAAMNRASHNRGRAEIIVLPVVGVEIFKDQPLEVEIGSRLLLPLSFWGPGQRRFTMCHLIPYATSLGDRSIFATENQPLTSVEDPIAENTCTWINVSGLAVGFSRLTVSYSYPSLTGTGIVKISDSITLAAYEPLQTVQPLVSSDSTTATVVLSVGASYDIVWSGGPQPWVLRPESHFHMVNVKDANLVEADERKVASGGIYVYRIVCNKLGETDMTLKVGNKQSPVLKTPVEAQSTVKVVCAEPDRLQLEANPERPQGYSTPCPLLAKTGRVSVLCYEELPINVTVFDSEGRKFDNFSNLDISWTISDDGLGTLAKDKGVILPSQEDTNERLGYRLAVAAQQMLTPVEKIGSVDVGATLKKTSSYLVGSFGSVSDTLQLQLVTDTEVMPKVVPLFNHPNNFATLSVDHGSGYFEIVNADQAIVLHKFTSSNRSVHLTPSQEGSTSLIARDLCLMATKEEKAKASVRVIGIHRVELLMVDKVQVDKSIRAEVKLWDQHDELIVPSSAHMQVVLSAAGKDIATIDGHQKQPLEFTLTGAKLGQTTITASVMYGRRRVTSSAMPLHVFPPLLLDPRNITLIIGATFQPQIFGGPGQSDSTIQYSLESNRVANVDTSSGLVKAMVVGSTRLTARAFGTDRTLGKKVVLSEDRIDVHVVTLEGVRIKAPLTRIRVGAEMPLSAVGLDFMNQNAYSFGSAIPHLQLAWSSSNQEVAELRSALWRNGLAPRMRNSAVMRLVAKKPGRIVIKVHAKITESIATAGQFQLDKDAEFTDQIEVVVIDDLAARAPSVPRNTLLMGVQSEYQLRTNREAGAKTIYYVLAKDAGLGGGHDEVITVSRNGLVKSGRNLGTAVILIRVIDDGSLVQEISITVQVKPLTYIMLNALRVMKPTSSQHQLTTWPLGLQVPLHISFHDDTGVKFDAVDESTLEVSTRPNRFDTNQIHVVDKKRASSSNNHSLAIELTMSELTVLRSFISSSDGKNRLDDFIVFDTKPGIVPELTTRPVVVGDVILFDKHVTASEDNVLGKWSVDPPGMAYVDSDLGLAVALRSGLARLACNLDETRSISIDLNVQRASKIVFQSRSTEDLGRHLTHDQANVQAVSFSILSEDGQAAPSSERQVFPNLHFSSSTGQNNASQADGSHFTKTLYTCDAKFVNPTNNFDDYLTVEAAFSGGHYVCLFRAALSAADQKSISDDLEVTVVPSASMMPAAKISTRVPFSSPFKIGNNDGGPLVLTNVAPSAEVTIIGLPHVLDSVTVTPSDTHLISVGRSYFGNEDNTRSWPVNVRSAFWTEAKPGVEVNVRVASSVTGQSAVVPVKIMFRGDQCANIELGWSSLIYFLISHYQSLLFIIASCVICVFVTRVVSQSAKTSTSKSSASSADINAFNTPNGMPRVANLSSSPSSLLLNSESKPFVWTVDKSPVYGSPATPSLYHRKSPRSLTQYSYTDNN